jgi:peroxin-1
LKSKQSNIIGESLLACNFFAVYCYSDSPFFLVSVLHPLVRLDLELALYFSSIRLRPTSAPEYLDMDSIVLRHIQIDKDHSPSSYLIPSLEPSPMVKIRPPIHDEYLTLPLNSVIPSSWLTNGEKEEASTRLLRIEGKEDYVDSSIALSSILVFDHADRINLFQNYGQNNGDPQVLLQPKMDYMANTLNDSVVSSIDWTENILLDLQRNPSIMISICGETGSGKTYSALLLCALARLKYQKATLYLDCKQLQESTSSIGEILSQFDTVFELACDSQDCIIIMENLDRLAPNLLGSDDSDSAGRVQSANPIAVSQSKVIADRILQLIEATVIQESIILSLVITCPEVDSIHPSLHQLTPIFQRQMTVPVLCAKERLSVLKQMMGRLSLPQSDSFEEITLRHLTESFRPRDLEKISFRVSQLLRASTKLTLEEILSSVLEDYTPVSHLSLKQKNKKRLVQPSWSNIGGLHQVKSSLEETMLYPTRYRLIYEQATVRLPRGVLLFGPPGCGKSTLVPALAQLCSMPLVSCKGPEILDKYIGASEAKVRELFQRASSVAPSILFLDELDALSPRRGSDHTGVTDRVVNQLLTFLDGVEESSGRVYVVGASSRPDKIDPALLRPGRLEQHFYVGPPKSYEELYDVFCKVAQGWNLSEECQVLVNSQEEAGSAFLTSIVMDGSSRFSPADMKAALDTAHVTAVHRTLELAKPEDISKVEIYKEDLIAALKITRPSLNVDESRVLEQVYKSFKRVKGLTSQGQNQNLKTTLR